MHLVRVLRRFARALVAVVLVVLAVGALGLKGWLSASGPFLEALDPYPYCEEARHALHSDRVSDAIELAEAGACTGLLAEAEDRWAGLASTAARCWQGVWTGRADDGTGVACAVASDLVVFGDVRDLTRQGLAWGRGDGVDPVLVALSGAGVALTFAPALGAGTSLLKGARRAGALTRGLGDALVVAVRTGSWRSVAGIVGDAGRVAGRLGPARGTRALAYADTPADLTALASFVERAPHPLVALRLGGKRVVAIGDDGLYRAALHRGPAGLALAAERGGRALLARAPFVTFAAKSLYKHPDAIAAWALAFAAFLLRALTWPVVLASAAALVLVARLLWPYRGRSSRSALRSIWVPRRSNPSDA